MKNSKELKKEAKESLKGNYGKAAGMEMVFLVTMILAILVAAFIPIIGSLIVSILVVSLQYGCITVLMRMKRKEEVSAFACLGNGIKKVWKVICCNFWFWIKLIPCSLLMLVAVILGMALAKFGVVGVLAYIALVICSTIMLMIEKYKYSLINFLIFDSEELSAKDIVNKSAELMQGNCKRKFLLDLSFIGWIFLVYIVSFLCTLLLGAIGTLIVYLLITLFLLPYIQMTGVCFYEELIAPTGGVEILESFEENDLIQNI